jgi:hypothetical protein
MIKRSPKAQRQPNSTLVNPMNKLGLEETEILDAFENGTLRPVKNRSREFARHRKAAEATFAKNPASNRQALPADSIETDRRSALKGIRK